jgi:uncharacterized alpha-E superfamily protein
MLSRVADNLYWMSRYLERSQHTARLLDEALDFMLDQSPQLIERRWNRTRHSLHVYMPRSFAEEQAASHNIPEEGGFDARALAHRLAFDANNEISIFSCVRQGRENARQVREEISGEMWECLNRLYLRVRAARPVLEAPAAKISHTDGASQRMGARAPVFWEQPHEFFADVQRSAFEFEGATDATMRHGEGWLFIQVGRGLEQAAKTASLLNAYFSEGAMETLDASIPEGSLKWTALLKSCAAFEPYCRHHSPRLSPEKIAHFLLLDDDFPRSVRAAALRIENALREIAEITGRDSPLVGGDDAKRRISRLAGRLKAKLDYASLEEVMVDGLPAFLQEIQDECVRIHYAIYHVYIGYMAE